MPHDVTGQGHWHEPTGEKAKAGFGKFKRPPTPYDRVHGGRRHPGVPRHRRAARCRTCRSCPGSGSAAAARTSSSTAPRANGAATSSRCPAPARSTPSGISMKRSMLVVEGRGTTEVWQDGRASATSSNGRRARCSRFRSMPGTASSMPASRRPCCSAARRRRT